MCKLKFNKTKLTRAAERTKATGATENETRRDSKRFHIETKDAICFICERNDRLENLRQVMTLECGRKLTEIATLLHDVPLLAKLSGGDAVAQELKYHLLCYTRLENRKRSQTRLEEQARNDEEIREKEAHAIALSELVTYIYEKRVTSPMESPPIFQLKDLTDLYVNRLKQLGVTSPSVNKTRLKEQLFCPALAKGSKFDFYQI